MAPELSSYELRMRDGNTALGEGRFFDALNEYGGAAHVAIDDAEKASALQMKAVTYSMAAQDEAATRAVKEAMKVAGDDIVLKGRISRDAAMIMMRIAAATRIRKKRDRLAHDALKMLMESLAYLRGPDHVIEFTVTLGFLGRYELLFGKKKWNAQHILENAGATLHEGDNRIYELNNLMWLIRAVPAKERPALQARILPLIETTGQTFRYDQLALIMRFGNRTYMYVEQRPWMQRTAQKAMARIKRFRGK
jgi:hypothetical protein